MAIMSVQMIETEQDSRRERLGDQDGRQEQGDDDQRPCCRLYSGRAEHFWTKGAPNLTKFFLVLQYMEKLRSSPSEHFLVIRVCQK